MADGILAIRWCKGALLGFYPMQLNRAASGFPPAEASRRGPSASPAGGSITP